LNSNFLWSDRSSIFVADGTNHAIRKVTPNLAPPFLNFTSPTVGVQGTSPTVTLHGTDFVPGATAVLVSGTGITVTSVVVNSGTLATARFIIDAAAAPTSRTVSIMTPGGTSSPVNFAINPPPF